jgi:hypothetical protein
MRRLDMLLNDGYTECHFGGLGLPLILCVATVPSGSEGLYRTQNPLAERVLTSLPCLHSVHP